MQVTICPDQHELDFFLNSATAKAAFTDRKALFFSANFCGTKYRYALLQEGSGTQVETGRFIVCANEADLKDNLDFENKRRK